MDENWALPTGDANLKDAAQKPTGEPKVPRSVSQFQKNYPKNIFIPIIEYLADLGLKTNYQQCVGTREQIQGKNVVSLSLIHQLLSQEWFKRNVNKKHLELNISNKILMNSKIKKKLFHLKVIDILLNSYVSDVKNYKKTVSNAVNHAAAEIQEDDELFQFPSSVVYLLNLFFTTLKILLKLNENFVEPKEDPENSSNTSKQANSKEELKLFVKNLVEVLNRTKVDRQTWTEIQQKISNTIQARAKQLSQKYSLASGVPCWTHFCSCIVSKCLEYRIGQHKLTSSNLNQWISEFKQKTSRVGLDTKASGCPIQCDLKSFTPTILILPPMVE